MKIRGKYRLPINLDKTKVNSRRRILFAQRVPHSTVPTQPTHGQSTPPPAASAAASFLPRLQLPIAIAAPSLRNSQALQADSAGLVFLLQERKQQSRRDGVPRPLRPAADQRVPEPLYLLPFLLGRRGLGRVQHEAVRDGSLLRSARWASGDLVRRAGARVRAAEAGPWGGLQRRFRGHIGSCKDVPWLGLRGEPPAQRHRRVYAYFLLEFCSPFPCSVVAG